VQARSLGDSLAGQMLYDVGLSYHQSALQSNDTAYYGLAARAYEQYIRTYPRSKKANECHYNFAEILFSLGDYYRAAEEYMAVSQRYPESKYRETAAWNAIVASQNLLKREKAVKR
jgi:TolA-binding protein